MLNEKNKEIVIGFFEEVYNKRNLDYVLQFFSNDYFEHRKDGARANTDAIEIIKGAFKTFPDLKCEIEDIVVEEDNVFVRLMFTATHKGSFIGVEASGNPVRFEAMEQFKIKNYLIRESWGSWPLYDILKQIK